MEATGTAHLPQLLQALRAGGDARRRAASTLERALGQREARDVLAVCERLPVVGLSWQPAQLAQQRQGQAEGGAGATSYTLEVELQRLAGKGGGRQTPPRVYAPRFPKARGAPVLLRLACCELSACLHLLRASGRCKLASLKPATLQARSPQRPPLHGTGRTGAHLPSRVPAPALWLCRAAHCRQQAWRCPAPRVQVKEEGWWLVAGDTSRGSLFALKRVSFGQRTTTRYGHHQGVHAGFQWRGRRAGACVRPVRPATPHDRGPAGLRE